MSREEFTYETLRDTHERERRGNKLTGLPSGFYDRAQDYLDQLRAEYEAAHEEDPGSTEVRLLQDEYQSARDSLVAVYDLRVRKVLQMAHTASKGGTVDADPLSPQEVDLYEDLLERLEAAREAVLKGARKGEKRILVRITEDLPPVTGADLRVYLLKGEDVVSLPEDTAEVLLKRGKAVELGI